MSHPQPSWKRPLYLCASMVLWGLLGFVLQLYLVMSSSAATVVDLTFWIVVPLGVVAGFFIGRIWYRMIYLEGRRWHHIRFH